MTRIALGFSGILVSMTFLMIVPADAQQKKQQPVVRGEQCRQACEADLRARGLWTKLPYGTCRRRCGIPL